MPEKDPKIIDYDHYSTFLKAKFLLFKSKKRGFSYRSCAKKITSTPSYVQNVIEGRRRVGLTRISKIASLFELSDFETQYFSIQVIRDLIKDERTRTYFTQILGRLKYLGTHLESGEELGFTMDSSIHHSNWLSMALMEMMSFSDYEDKESWMRSKLIDGADLTPMDIRHAINELLERDLIERKGDKYIWKIPSKTTTDPFDETQLARPFDSYRSIVKKTWDALGSVDKYRPNHFFEGVIAVNYKDMRLMEKAAERYRDEIMRISNHSKSPTRVVIVSSNLFHLTKSADEPS